MCSAVTRTAEGSWTKLEITRKESEKNGSRKKKRASSKSCGGLEHGDCCPSCCSTLQVRVHFLGALSLLFNFFVLCMSHVKDVPCAVVCVVFERVCSTPCALSVLARHPCAFNASGPLVLFLYVFNLLSCPVLLHHCFLCMCYCLCSWGLWARQAVVCVQRLVLSRFSNTFV